MRSLAILMLPVLLMAGCAADVPVSVEAPSPEVGVVQLTPRSVIDWAELPADLIAERQATLAAEVPGRVESMRVDSGDAVARGSVIATIDERTLEQQLAEAEAFHRQAVVDAQSAEALFGKRSITRQNLIQARTNLEVASARLASARLAREKSTIRAPWSGHVAARHVEQGDYLQPGQPVVGLVADARLKVRAPVAATDAPLVEAGRPVEVMVEGFGDEVFVGEIVRVGATLDASSRTMDVEALIDNPEGRLKAGMYGRMRFPRKSYEAALLVPLSALLDSEAGKYLYRVDQTGVVERVEPGLGAIVGEEVIVETGLEAGDLVVVQGNYRVSDGMQVETRRIES